MVVDEVVQVYKEQLPELSGEQGPSEEPRNVVTTVPTPWLSPVQLESFERIVLFRFQRLGWSDTERISLWKECLLVVW